MLRTLRNGRRRERVGADAGVALVMTLGIMLVGAIILTTLAIVTVYNSKTTATTKVEMRALASADAGIDLVLSQLQGKKYNQLHQVCSQADLLVNNDDVDVVTSYNVNRAGTLVENIACPLATDIVTSLTVTSTATTSDVAITGGSVSRTVVTQLLPTPPEIILDKAIFSEGTITLNNSSEYTASGATDSSGNPVADAHIYTNGGLNCYTPNEIEGEIIAAHGPIYFKNPCKVSSSVWSSDSITFDSGATIHGDVYAASTDPTNAIKIVNGVDIYGSALTNGGIYTEAKGSASSGGIRGTAFARLGSITGKNNYYIRGSGYAGASVSLANGGYIGGDVIAQTGAVTDKGSVGRNVFSKGAISNQVSVAGTKTTGVSAGFPATPYPAGTFPPAVGYPNNIQVPPREQMPIITMNSADILLWEAAGYTVERYTNQCTGSAPQSILNANTGSPRLIIFEGCTNPVTFTNQVNISLQASIAMVSTTGFKSENKFEVTTNSTGDLYKMHWIVPADTPGVTWVNAGSGQTTPSCASADTGKITLGNNVIIDTVESFFYTPCTFYQQNGWNRPLIGQIYGGTVTTQNSFLMQMATVPVPSLTDGDPDPNSEAEMQVLSRYDLHG